MILDKISNSKYYLNTHPLFAKAFEYLEAYFKNPIEPGKYEICGSKETGVQGKGRRIRLMLLKLRRPIWSPVLVYHPMFNSCSLTVYFYMHHL